MNNEWGGDLTEKRGTVGEEKDLSERHESEISFHDKKANRFNKKSFYNQGALINRFYRMLDIIGNLEGKSVLDLGCGDAWASIHYVKRGAHVVGIDISGGRLVKAKEDIDQGPFKGKIQFVQGSVEYLPLNSSFDLVIGIAILHHLELESTIRSIKSVLKKDGRVYFMEPLDHNPFINLFRRLTPHRRTKDERPLSIDFINSLKDHFREVNIYGYDFFGLAAFAFIPLNAFVLFRLSHRILSKFDEVLFKLFPKLQKYCWGAIIELKK